MRMSKLLKRLEARLRWAGRASLNFCFWPLSRREFRSLLQAHPGHTTNELLALTHTYRGWGWYRKLKPLQVPSEFRRLIELANTVEPRVVLEIGTHKGGTLLVWTRIAREMVISVDLPGGIHGGGYPAARARLFEEFKRDRPGLELVLLGGDSDADAAKADSASVVRGRMNDIIILDGETVL